MGKDEARSHAKIKKIFCAACGKKDPKCFPMTNTLENLIKNEVYSLYSADDESFPGAVCASCRTNLFTAQKGNVVPVNVRERWSTLDYSQFRPPTRNGPCTSCTMCNAARFTQEKVQKKKPPELPRITPPTEEKEEKEDVKA